MIRAGIINQPHGQRLFSACSGRAENFIEIESDPWKIADIFKKGEKRKENCHRRKHNRHDPAKYVPDSVQKKTFEHGRNSDYRKHSFKMLTNFSEKRGKQFRRIVCAGNSKPENKAEKNEHGGYPKSFSRQQGINGFVLRIMVSLF